MKPEYDEAAEILNKGTDVSLSTFVSVRMFAACISTGLCASYVTLYWAHTIMRH